MKPDLAGIGDSLPASLDLITSKPQTRQARNVEDSDEEDRKDNESDDWLISYNYLNNKVIVN